MTFILGLSGGIGSGKSAASQWFEQQGIEVVDADVVAREVVAVGQPCLTKIAQHFGEWVLDATGELNRRALREYIFQHPVARRELEQITHPAIRASIQQQLRSATSPYVVLVSPLLFETDQHRLTHRTLLIDAPEQLQLQRASQRDDQSVEQIKSIMASQMSRSDKQALADDVVSNEADLTQLYQQLKALHQHYLTLAHA